MLILDQGKDLRRRFPSGTSFTISQLTCDPLPIQRRILHYSKLGLLVRDRIYRTANALRH